MHHEGFLRSILENPGDDGVRLIYADWLEENGDPERAEFVRAQIELDLLPEEDPRRATLTARARSLLDAHQRSWVKPIKHLAEEGVFRRGFLERVTLRAETFVEQGHLLFRYAPIQHVHLREARPVLREVLQSPYLAHLQGLDLRGNLLTNQEMEQFAYLPRTSQLTLLDLGNNEIGDEGLARICTLPALARLRTLDLSLNLLTPTAGRQLAGASFARNLTLLDLGGNALRNQGLRQLVAGNLENLTTLRMGSNRITGQDLTATLARASLPCLTTLDLSWNPLDLRGLRALANSPLLASVQVLDLGRTHLRPRCARVLAESPHVGNLGTLRLDGNEINWAGLVTLLGSERFSSLIHLDIRYNQITPPEQQQGQLRLPPRLRLLNLEGNLLDADSELFLHASGLREIVRW